MSVPLIDRVDNPPTPNKLLNAGQIITGSGIVSSRPIESYSPYSKNVIPHPRSNYPTNSFSDSRESLHSTSSYNEYMNPQLQLAATAFEEKGKDLGLKNIIERTKRDESLIPDIKVNKDKEGHIIMPKCEPKQQVFHYATTTGQLGKKQPKLSNTKEYRYFPRTHNFTKTFTGTFRSWGLTH